MALLGALADVRGWPAGETVIHVGGDATRDQEEGTTMSTGATGREPEDAGEETVPVAPDRPVVDGRGKSSEELREEVVELDDDRLRHIDELRAELGDTVEELVARLDVPARVQAKKVETVAAAQQQFDRMYRLVVEKAEAVRKIMRDRPGAVTGAAALLLLVVLRRRRRRKARVRAADGG
jgi:Protein of unknown function (DUF3618)